MKNIFNKLIILVFITIFCSMFSQDNNTLKIFYNKKENLLKIKICEFMSIEIDKKLRLFNNQYSMSDSYFQLEIFENEKQVFPKALDALIFPTEEAEVVSKQDSQENILYSNEENIYSFIILDENNVKNQMNNLKRSDTIYFYSFKKNVKYKLRILLIQKSKTYQSNMVEFVY